MLPLRLDDPPLAAASFPNADRHERLLDSVPALVGAIEDFMAADHIPGLAAGLVIDDQLAWSQGFGVADLESKRPVTPRSVFRIGSITKTLTMTAILRLRDEGLVDLDAPLAAYVEPATGIVHPTDERAGFTVRQVLLHASGLPRTGTFDFESPDHLVDRPQIERSLDGLPLAAPPGLSRAYSNLGFQLLGLLIEDLTGEDHRQHLHRVLLEPLGMRASVWHAADAGDRVATPYALEAGRVRPIAQEDHGAASAAGGLYSSVEDMARYAAFQLSAWPPRAGDDDGPLSRASVREAHRIHGFPRSRVVIEQGRESAQLSGQGLAWHVMHRCDLDHVVMHNGRNTGYTASLLLLPRRGVGVVLLSNQHSTDLAELGMNLLDQLASNPALTRRRAPTNPNVEQLGHELLAAGIEGDDERMRSLLAAGRWDPERTATLLRSWEDIRAHLGSCEAPATIEIEGSQIVARARCERGRLRVQASAMTTGLTDVGVFVEQDEPSEPLKIALHNVERLLVRWDESVAAQTFAPQHRPSRYRSAFRSVPLTRGRCSIGPTVFATDRLVEVRLSCERSAAILTLASNGEPTASITGVWIRDDPDDPRTCVGR